MGKNAEKQLNSYKEWLFLAEKSPATIEKYVHIVRAFFGFLGEKRLEKEQVLAYKEKLVAEHQPAGVDAKLAALNSYLKFIRKPEYCVKYLKIQKKMYRNEERELSKEEYLRLEAAAGTTQIAYIMKTILATGIRVSELELFGVADENPDRAGADHDQGKDPAFEGRRLFDQRDRREGRHEPEKCHALHR